MITRDIAVKVLEVVDVGLSSGLGNRKPGEMCVEAAVCYAMGLPHGDNPSCVARALRSLKISLNDRAWSSKQARAAGLRRLAIAQLGSADALDEKEFTQRVIDYTIRATVPRAMRIAASVTKNAKYKAAMIAAALKCEREGNKASALEARSAAYAANAADAAYAAADAAYAATSANAANAAAYAAYAATAANAATYAANAADAAYAAANAADAADAAADAAYAATSAADAANAAAYAANAAASAAAAKKRDEELSTFAEGIVQILIAMKAPGCEFLDLAPLEVAA